MKIGILETIDSGHHLPRHPKCGHPHGHTYTVEVVIEGKKKKGMVLEFGEARDKVRAVLKKYDHTVLNNLIAYPTCENICEAIYRDLKRRLPGLKSVRLWEGQGKWAETP
jgi:6-pyruvoyltetrahydropterin/6-carboxytetrahydropterin synthase